MKRLIIILLAMLLLFTGCSGGSRKFDLVLDANEITRIRIQDRLEGGDFSTIDLEDDINYFCDEFNKIKFRHIKTYSDMEARPAGSMYAISISLKGGSSISFSILYEKSIQIGDDIYRSTGDKLMNLMDYDFQYAEFRAIYEFADSINEKLSEYEHFKGTEVDKDENIVIVYSSSMDGEVIDEFRSIIGASEYSIICMSAE